MALFVDNSMNLGSRLVMLINHSILNMIIQQYPSSMLLTGDVIELPIQLIEICE